MCRLVAVQPGQATGQAKELLDAVKAKFKFVPDLTRVMANSPAHTAIGKMTGLSEAELEMARSASSASPKIAAALRFAKQLVASKGRVSEVEWGAVRQAGYTDAEIAEIIAHVALNIFTNYFNNAAGVEVDFPKIALRQSA